MEIVAAKEQDRQKKIEDLYMTAFPKSERKPFDLMCRKQQEGFVDMLSIEENGSFVGLAITVKNEDLILLDYFAIDGKNRGGGLGSRALNALAEFYKGKRMVLEIESTEVEAENQEQRRRRKAFYYKNRMTKLDYTINLFGVEMEILSNGTEVSCEEYMELYIKAFGPRIKEYISRIN